MDILTRYHDALHQLPAPGCGLNCHNKLLSPATLGVLAGLDSERISEDIRRAIPLGKRKIKDKEITDAINRALSDHKRGTFTPQPQPKPIFQDGTAALQRIIDKGLYHTEAELKKTSPVPIPDDPRLHAKLFIETRYQHNDLPFIGEQYKDGILGENIIPAVDWCTYFLEGGKTAPHIIINPLTGKAGLTKDGKLSYRCDDTVKEYRYCMAEFDNLNREDQIRFWSAVKLPIVCLIDTGGKSIHAWLQVSKMGIVTTPEAWEKEIKNDLYARRLIPMGVDAACSNPARLSRLPGHYRAEKAAWQRLLWLSHDGAPLCK
jgi:hypothetical protein